MSNEIIAQSVVIGLFGTVIVFLILWKLTSSNSFMKFYYKTRIKK